MRINELRKMVGKQIQWEEYYCQKSGHGLPRSGVLLEVKGKNLLIDQMGSVDWKWTPDMLHLRLVVDANSR